jgi:hypothetical protein
MAGDCAYDDADTAATDSKMRTEAKIPTGARIIFDICEKTRRTYLLVPPMSHDLAEFSGAAMLGKKVRKCRWLTR